MGGDPAFVSLQQLRDIAAPIFEHQPEHVFHEAALEALEAARLESRTANRQLAGIVDQHVVLHLVAEHRRITSVDFELDALGHGRRRCYRAVPPERAHRDIRAATK